MKSYSEFQNCLGVIISTSDNNTEQCFVSMGS